MPSLLTQAQVVSILGVSRATLQRMKSRGEFIAPVHVGPRRIAYDARDLASWLAARTT